MILVKLYSLFATVITWVVSFLPSMSLPSVADVSAAIGDSRLWDWWAWANHYEPMDLLLALLSLRLAVWVGLHAVDAINWTLTKLHIAGGSS